VDWDMDFGILGFWDFGILGFWDFEKANNRARGRV